MQNNRITDVGVLQMGALTLFGFNTVPKWPELFILPI
jgi:hypothetical protein